MIKHFYIHKECGGRVTNFNLWIGICEECGKKVHYKQCTHETRETGGKK
jgi:hypothetical protein